MADLDLQAITDRALRAIPREALAFVAEHGLPDGHAFYVVFRTDAPGAMVPAFLRDRPELTVVLERQFWDLQVDADGWSVNLRFNGQLHRVGSPWEALTGFADPPVQFGLRFGEARDVPSPIDAEGEEPPAAPGDSHSGNVVSFRRPGA